MAEKDMTEKTHESDNEVTMSEVLDRMIKEGYNKGVSIGRTEGISIGEARGRSEAKKEYEEELAKLRAKLARYEAQELSN